MFSMHKAGMKPAYFPVNTPASGVTF